MSLDDPIEPPEPLPERQSVDRATVLDAVTRMTAELTSILPADDARERANNIAQVLQEGDIDPVDAVRDALKGRLVLMPNGMRILAIARVAAAWTSTVQTRVYRETEPTPIEDPGVPGWARGALQSQEVEPEDLEEDCATCSGSGGGQDPALRCQACGGSGRSSESVQREEDDRAEARADQAQDRDDYGDEDGGDPW